MLGVALVEQVIHPGAELDLPADAVSPIEREHAEAGTVAEVLPYHVAAPVGGATLTIDHAPERTDAPGVTLVAQAQARFQRRHLRQRFAVRAVLAPGVGQGRIGLPVGGEGVGHAQLTTHDARIDVVGLGAHAAIVEQDVVAHLPGIGRGPGLQLVALVLDADVELSGLLRLDAVERIGRTGRAVQPGREQLPVIRKALHMAEAGIEGSRRTGQVMLVAHETAGQGLGTHLTRRRVGPRHAHHAAKTLPVILGRGSIQPRPGDQPITLGQAPGGLGECAVVMHQRVLAPGEAVGIRVARHHAVGGTTAAMLAALRIDAGDQLEVVPLPGRRQPGAEGAPVDLRGHRHGHHAGRVRHAQAEVVHDVVGVVVVDLGLDLIQRTAEVAALDAQAQAFALELAAIHAAPGVARLAIATTSAEFDQGVGIRGPAQGYVTVPLVPARGDGVAVTVVVVIRMRTVGHHPQVALLTTHGAVDQAVEAPVGTRQHAGM